jgi:uncharacterized protein YndB with AHSA1/START domain
MPVTAVEKDADAATLTVTAEFDADIDDVWEMWANPRLLERWWGPPGFGTTFVDHELTPGARSNYFMEMPDGSKAHASWVIVSVDPPHGFEALDGDFADTGAPDPDTPITKMTVAITEVDNKVRMVVNSFFPSGDAMIKTAAAGFEEGMRGVVVQFEEMLAGLK